MPKLGVVKFLALVVALVGLSAVMGWILDIDFLKSTWISPTAMKFTTAMGFVASSIVLYSAATEKNEASFVVQVVLPAAILLILLQMVTLLISVIFGFQTDIDVLFMQEKSRVANVFISGRPSIPTMVGLILVAVSGIWTFIGWKKHLLWMGGIIMIIGGTAALGYMTQQPFLYYMINSISTAMALNTAMLFILIGSGFILCGKTILEQN